MVCDSNNQAMEDTISYELLFQTIRSGEAIGDVVRSLKPCRGEIHMVQNWGVLQQSCKLVISKTDSPAPVKSSAACTHLSFNSFRNPKPDLSH